MSASIPTDRPNFAATGFVRLWAVGGISGAMMWLEVLAASLFTFQVTQSAWAVALVSAARAAPLLLFGAAAGVFAEVWSRRKIVRAGLLLGSCSAAGVTVLAAAGLIRPWHLAVAGFISGSVYATEFPARRRMVAESAGPSRVGRAVAIDSLTSYAARCGGPLAAGLALQAFGLPGAFLISCIGNGTALAILARLADVQEVQSAFPRPTRSTFRGDLREARRFVARSPVLPSLLGVTLVMNLCGYSYATLIPSVGLGSLGLDNVTTGVLAAAEPAGALCGGLALTRCSLPGPQLAWLAGGVAVLAVGLLAAAGLGAAGAAVFTIVLALAFGGFGSAVYTTTQTSLVLAETPPQLRSRVLGLLTVCIGSWPFGMLLAGAAAKFLPPLGALAALACTCLALLGLVVTIGGGLRAESRDV